MKYAIVIIIILSGCQKEQTNPKHCHCGVVTEIGANNAYTVKNYCTSNESLFYANTRYKVGDEFCGSNEW